jgi:RNA polymerase sigma-70 factor (ECF subfamily)
MSIPVKIVVQVLMQQHNRLFAYIWSIVGDAQLAEDAMQELSVLAVEKGVEVADEDRLVVWLWRAAKLKALEFRRQKRMVPLPLEGEVADQLEQAWQNYTSPGDSQLAEALQQCITSLTPDHRELLRLRYTEGKKAGDIARALKRKAASVYQAIARLHRSLRDCIEARLKESLSNG